VCLVVGSLPFLHSGGGGCSPPSFDRKGKNKMVGGIPAISL